MKHKVYKLPNGITVILVPHKSLNSVTIEAISKYGSAFETHDTSGITHFVEHITLTSTKKWPVKADFNKLVEFNGATYNGSTGNETVHYYINLPKTKLEFGVEYIYEILYNALFKSEDVESERTVILDEISKAQNSLERRAYYFGLTQVFQNQSAFTFDVLGSAENVSNFKVEDLKQAYKKMHDPMHLTLVISGNFNETALKKLLDKYFAPQKSDFEGAVDYPLEAINQGVVSTKTDSKSDLVMFGNIFRTKGAKQITYMEDSVWAISLWIIANTSTSRLYTRLREKEGLLYDIYADRINYANFGGIAFTFEVSPEKFEKTLKIYLEEMLKVFKHGITQEELDHYKEFYYNRKLLRYDSFSANKDLIVGSMMLDGKVYTSKKILSNIKKIKLKDVNGFIKNYFDLKDSSFVIYGKVDEKTDKVLKSAIKGFHNTTKSVLES